MDSRHSNPGSSSYLGLLNSQEEGFLHPNFPYESYNPSVQSVAFGIPPFSSQAPTPPAATPVPSRERRKWSPEDDEVLISAWLNTSKDPIIGNDQKAGTFWKRVGEYYADTQHAQESGVTMEQRHCRQRFHKINDFVNKWCGAFATAERLNSSGQNESDVLKVAHDIFYSDNNIKFNLEHCWCMLRYEPKWICLNTPKPIPSIRYPQGKKNSLFSRKQEAKRKDVERAFGVLQARFAIVKNPSRSWDKLKIANIMRACIILHNMIVEDERDSYNLRDVSEFDRGEDADLTYSISMRSNLGTTITRRTSVRDTEAHEQLKNDLIEHIWDNFGHLPDDEEDEN